VTTALGGPGSGCLTELQYEENHSFVIDYAELDPPPGLKTLECSQDVIPFDPSGGLTDPDGDKLYWYWFVNYKSEQPSAPFSLDPSGSLELTRCPVPTGFSEGFNVLELVVHDRKPGASTLEVHNGSGEGNTLIILWTIDMRTCDCATVGS
jgi:hypothetical protein